MREGEREGGERRRRDKEQEQEQEEQEQVAEAEEEKEGSLIITSHWCADAKGWR